MTVYVAGPYRSRWGILGRALNIWRARRVAIRYWQAGHAVICPHMNSAFMDGIIPDKEWVERDLAILEHCDLIVLLPGWRESEGARCEFEFARQWNIPYEEV